MNAPWNEVQDFVRALEDLMRGEPKPLPGVEAVDDDAD